MRVWLGFFISIVGVIFVLYKLDWKSFYESLLRIEPLYVIYAVLLMFVNLLIRAKRWQILLKPFIQVRLINDSFNYYSIGYMANMLLPLKPGEILRPYLLGKKLNAQKTPLFATVLLERLWDITFLAMLFILTISFSDIDTPFSVSQPVLLIGFFGLIAISIIWILLMKPSIRTRISYYLSWLPDKYVKKFKVFINLSLEGTKSLINPRYSLYLFLLTGIIYLCSIFMVILCAKAFGITLYWYVPIIAVVIANYGMMIPSTPSAIGLAHALWVFSLILFGVDKDEALGVALIMHGIGFLVVVLTGMISLWLEELNFGQLRKMMPLSD